MPRGYRATPGVTNCIQCGAEAIYTNSKPPKYCTARCRDRAKYLRNQDRIKEAARVYRKENQELVRGRARESRRKNPERAREHNRNNYIRHREKRIAGASAYAKAHPEIAAATRHRRRDAGGFQVSGRDLMRLKSRNRNQCSYCGIQLNVGNGRDFPNSLQWDHVIPLSRGGRNSIGNIVPACRSCNIAKGASTVMEWRRRAGKKNPSTEVEDLKKARANLDRRIEKLENKNA